MAHRTFRGVGILGAVAATALFASVSAAHAAGAEQVCQKDRYRAAAKYASCQQRVLAKGFGGSSADQETALSKCRVNYTGTWAKLQVKAIGSGSTCDNGRYEDNSNGTVTDRLTSLQWEQKTDDGTIHDKDNIYTWSASPYTTAADGTAFATFLSMLNSGGCFAGQCDWRLPTLYELQTILLAPYPCTTSPCIDQGVFGPTSAYYSWSATTAADYPYGAWYVYFDTGDVSYGSTKGYILHVRAVRGGL